MPFIHQYHEKWGLYIVSKSKNGFITWQVTNKGLEILRKFQLAWDNTEISINTLLLLKDTNLIFINGKNGCNGTAKPIDFGKDSEEFIMSSGEVEMANFLKLLKNKTDKSTIEPHKFISNTREEDEEDNDEDQEPQDSSGMKRIILKPVLSPSIKKNLQGSTYINPPKGTNIFKHKKKRKKSHKPFKQNKSQKPFSK